MADNDGYPKICCICGERLKLTGPDSHRFHADDRNELRLSWHVKCERPGWPHLRGR